MINNEELTTWPSHVRLAFIAHTLFAVASTLLTISKVLEVVSSGRIDELNSEERKFHRNSSYSASDYFGR